MPPSRYAPGTRIGPFVVVAELGRGAMGVVLHVQDAAQRDLALKLFKLAAASGPSAQRFQREAEITASLRHSGLIKVHDYGAIDEQAYIAYELVPGGRTLDSQLDASPRPELLRLLVEVATAVGYAHAQGVIHRDLKPENVLVDEAGHARVADFGLAKAQGLERLTRSGVMLGTPTTMAPEQVAGVRDDYGPPTDVWALGAVLYRILCGTYPFEAEGLAELAARIVTAQPKPPRQVDPGVSPALEAVCLRALSKEPAQRFADGAAFAEALEQAIRAPHAPAGRGRIVALGLGAVIGVGLLVGALLPSEPTPEPAVPAEPAAEAVDPELEALRLRLRTSLEAASVGELEQGLARLDAALLGRDPECVAQLRAAQTRWVATLEERIHGDVGTWSDPLSALVALHTALPAGERAFPGHEALADRLLAARLPHTQRSGAINFELLEFMADLELRMRDPELSSRLFSLLVLGLPFEIGSGKRTPDQALHAVVLAAKLDLAFSNGCDLRAEGEELAKVLPLGDGVWARYVHRRLRWEPDGPPLDDLYFDPPAGLDLGPRHTLDLACIIVQGRPPGETESVLESALAQHGEHVLARLLLARALCDLGRPAEGLPHAERAAARYRETGQLELHKGRLPHGHYASRLAWVYAANDRREEAREALALLEDLTNSNRRKKWRKKLLAKFPWLGEPR